MAKKKTILFVDDDPIAMGLLIEEFKKVFGSSVSYEKATTAEEAEEIILEELAIKGRLPSMIVSDWMMPGKRGDQFLKEIRKMYPEIKLVLHSGLADQALVDDLNEQADLLCALPKPWNGKQNVERIFQAISG